MSEKLYFEPFCTAIEAKEGMNENIASKVKDAGILQEHGIALYSNSFIRTHTIDTVIQKGVARTKEELQAEESTLYSIAGRVLLLRSFGKTIFIQIEDASASMQIYVSKALLGDVFTNVVEYISIGDIIGVSGFLFRTKTDELTLKVTSLELITKSLRSLPEKFHGLTDVETRYRQRYLDLLINKDVRTVFTKRALIVREFRNFLETEGFIEVETPMLHSIAGGAAARPFKTHHNALDMELSLRIAPELYLKRLLVGGLEKVFEINRNFRNEGISVKHNPEFTMCEFYWAYATYVDLMDLTERLISYIAEKVCGTTVIEYQKHQIDLTAGKWKRITFYDSLKEIGGHEDSFLNNIEAMKEYIVRNGVQAPMHSDIAYLHESIFDIDVEEKLIQPTFIFAYPTALSPLSRRNEENPDIVDRFEFFVAGRELANAFSELNDPIDQRLRFMEQMKNKDLGDEEACEVDEDYLRALEYGMPPAAGEGVGIDRLAMLLTNSASIRDVILFPQLKREV